MAGTKRRSPTSTLVSKRSIQQASNALGDLPEKPKEIWSLREAIDALKDEVTLALDRGYTYPEISQMLTERGVEISASTLKYYLSSVKRASDPTAKTRRRRRTLNTRLNVEDLSLGMKEDKPAPAKRGRKPKAVVAAAAAAAAVEAAPVKVPGRRGRKPAALKAAEAAAAAAAGPVETPVRKKPGRKPKVVTDAAAPVAKPAGKVGRPAKGKVGRPPKATTAAKVAKPAKPAKVAKPAKAAKVTTKAPRGRKKAV
jgi:hypothetical protein